MDRGDFNINNAQLVVSVSALLDAWMPGCQMMPCEP